MRAPGIVESEVAGQLLPRLGDTLVGMQIDVLVLDALPQALDEHVGASSQLRRLATIRADVSE